MGEDLNKEEKVGTTKETIEDKTKEADNTESKKDVVVTEEKKEKVFTQAQVNAMMAKEKRQGKNSALKELGIDPNDTKIVKLLQGVLKNESPDNTEIDQKVAEAEQRAIIAEAKAESLKQGAQPAYVEDIVTLMLAKNNDDGLELNELVGEFKTKYPDWFKASEEDEKEKGGTGTGSTLKPNGKNSTSKETKGLGQRLAAQRKSNVPKKSYWS